MYLPYLTLPYLSVIQVHGLAGGKVKKIKKN